MAGFTVVLCFVFVCAALLDPASNEDPAGTSGFFVVMTVVVYLFCAFAFNSCIGVYQDGLLIKNIFVESEIPWSSIARFSGDDRVVVELHDGTRIRTWAVQAANGARMTGRVSRVDRVVDEMHGWLETRSSGGTSSKYVRRYAVLGWWQYGLVVLVALFGLLWWSWL
ncbi:PH domain-containing protein [Pengzhenrongella sicca]|uniref:PH domain-containing protein n=1 Tax=Pengzhenrongella sicca TaxID=2819238 RepID=A0A8A4ZAT8_9MICO|nr:PH domain-containing protein [Pengzhenrongella sicca]QTE28535.1 PH domain-containing protein [Pengzhenrongella sicca]